MTTPGADAAAPSVPGTAAAGTVAVARRALASQLRGSGIETPELDARLLIGHALGLDHAALAAAANRRLDGVEQDAIAALARRRLAHEPLARILGRKEFWSLALDIDAATLVPRPETETVVEAALAIIDARCRANALRIADLGTGSGALLLALLSEMPHAFGVGSDISFDAVRVARANARRLKLMRAAFVVCDMASALRGRFDLVVSNPPYIASGSIAALEPEVRDFEPRRALDGGADGLNYYRQIAATVATLLAPDGVVVVEVGIGQADAVAALFRAAGLVPSPPRHDLSGVPRAVFARQRHAGGALDPGKKTLGMSAGTD